MNDMKNIKDKIIIAIGLLLLAAAAYLGFYRCPVKLIFGFPCPSCGMTRAFRAVVHGNIDESFKFHPLWPLAALAIILIILNELKIIKPSKKLINFGAVFFIAALIICYVIRIVTHTLVW
ncbi:DUF2752 domain-containing protein [Lachnospiraceae bacterium C1.1]|nr:DUF2752 domain-containing protein [Lachnospiraceae bacterium C1.1]